MQKAEVEWMAEQERRSTRSEVDALDQGGGRVNSKAPAHEDDVSDTDQAIINQERALESGEENVI